uniref:Lipoprotein n=1 Tax=uncultured bacterium Contig643 TaxID=1393602 RepID=W0FH55_9BACT|nr:predicted protein [uncultured bacterium Contig643]
MSDRRVDTMKKLIIAAITCLAITLSGCGTTNTIVSESPVDADYIPAHDEIETTQEYEIDLLGDGGLFKLMPNTHTVHHPAEYRIQYRRTYENGDSDTYWIEVDRDEYEKIIDMLDE